MLSRSQAVGAKSLNNKIKAPIKVMLFSLYLVAVTLILLEIGVRIWGYSDRYIYDANYMPFDKAESIPYVLKPDLHNVRGRGDIILNTDSLGLRSITAGEVTGPKADNEYRIAIAGDSVTYGQGLKKTEDTYVQVLEDFLNRRQSALRVNTFNYAVPAYSVKEIAASLQYRMLDIKPDLVMMAIIEDNFNLSRTGVIDKWGYTAQKKTGGIPQGSVVKLLLRKIHLVYLLRNLAKNNCWFKKCQETPGTVLSDKLPESYIYLKRFKEVAEKNNLRYYIVLLPALNRNPLIQFDNPLFINQLERDGIAYIDLSWIRNEFTRDEFRANKFDGHPSAVVHWRIAEVLAGYIFPGLSGE